MPRRSYPTKYSYEQIKKAIQEHGAYKSTVCRALKMHISTLNKWLKYHPKLEELFRKTAKLFPRTLEDRIYGLLDDDEFLKTPVGKAYALRYLSNTLPKHWAVAQKKVTNNNTVNTVNVQNREIILTEDKKNEVLEKFKASHPELVDKAAAQIGLKELPPPGEVIENVPSVDDNNKVEERNDNPANPAPEAAEEK